MQKPNSMVWNELCNLGMLCWYTFYTKLVHVSCPAHALHRVTEDVRPNFLKWMLSCWGRRFSFRSPARKMQFKSMAPGFPLPPDPVITRWGMCIDATICYYDHFQVVKNIVDSVKTNMRGQSAMCKIQSELHHTLAPPRTKHLSPSCHTLFDAMLRLSETLRCTKIKAIIYEAKVIYLFCIKSAQNQILI
jgi:hypothetical protein